MSDARRVLPSSSPEPLQARAAALVEPDATGDPAASVLEAAMRAVVAVLNAPAADRATALDVLTADALVTRAVALSTGSPTDFEAQCARCIGRLTATLPSP